MSEEKKRIRVPWNKHETALLLKGCIDIDRGIKRSRVIRETSQKLRSLRASHGAYMDETFRNEAGISWQISYMYDLYTHKQLKGNYPRVFDEVVSIYHNDRTAFYVLLNEAEMSIKTGKVISSVEVEGDEESEFSDFMAGEDAVEEQDDSEQEFFCSDSRLSERVDELQITKSEAIVPYDKTGLPLAKEPIWEMIEVNPNEYKEISVCSIQFSVRAENALKKNRIQSIAELLLCAPCEVADWANVGKKTALEIVDKVCAFVSAAEHKGIVYINDSKQGRKFHKAVYSALNACILGEETEENLSKEEKEEYKVAKAAFDLLGDELFFAVAQNKHRFVEFVNALDETFAEAWQAEELSKQCDKALSSIIPIYGDLLVRPIVNAYYLRNQDNGRLFWGKMPQGLLVKDLKEFIQGNERDADLKACKEFLYWLQGVNVESLIENKLMKEAFAYKKIVSNDVISKERYIFEGRALGRKLEELGKYLGVTRERVRQQEKQIMRRFFGAYNKGRYDPLGVLLAIKFNGRGIISASDIEDAVGRLKFALLFKAFTNNSRDIGYAYVPKMNSFISTESKIKDVNWETLFKGLPALIRADEIDEIAEKEGKERHVFAEVIKDYIISTYKRYGKVYSATSITLSKRYEMIIYEHFPKGIRVYDDGDMCLFKEYYKDTFGDQEDLTSNHAIGSRIVNFAVLYDRGTYISQEYCVALPQLLIDDMVDYIRQKGPAVYYNSIFLKFNEKLLETGVGNMYYLKGLLDKALPSGMTPQKDYIYVGEQKTTAIESVVAKMRSFQGAFSIKDLLDAFEGVKEYTLLNVIHLEVANGLVCLANKKYIYIKDCDISDLTKVALKIEIEKMFLALESSYVSTRKLYARLSFTNKELLSKLKVVSDGFSMFSLLQVLFAEEYGFSRPFILKDKHSKIYGMQALTGYLSTLDKFDVDVIKKHSLKMGIARSGYLEVFEEMSDSHVQIGIDMMVSKRVINISDEDLQDIAKLLNLTIDMFNEIDVGKFRGYSMLPKLPLTWNRYLLVGIVRSYLGDKFEVVNTDNSYDQTNYFIRRNK